MSHRFMMVTLYLLTAAAVILVLVYGVGYYTTPLVDRPHLAQHDLWKSSGLIGHTLGIGGSLMVILLLAYVVRKNVRAMQSWGNIRHWLNVHMWMGVTAPLLLTFHSTFKVGGIVAISYWSMIAVALSGFVGRYIYIQIPRSISGDELSLAELEDWDRAMVEAMRKTVGVSDELIDRLQRVIGHQPSSGKGVLATLLGWIASDIAMPFRLLALRRELAGRKGLERREFSRLIRLARRRAILRRRMAFLRRAQKALHYWHVIHRPFALVMVIIMFVHITVSWLFGYRWIL